MKNFDPNDPKLTAYALGEFAALSRQEAEAMKQMIERDPEAKAFVDEVRQTADLVAADLGREDVPRLGVDEREHLLAQAKATPRRKAWWRRPRVGLSFGAFAAAAMIVLTMALVWQFAWPPSFRRTAWQPEQLAAGKIAAIDGDPSRGSDGNRGAPHQDAAVGAKSELQSDLAANAAPAPSVTGARPPAEGEIMESGPMTMAMADKDGAYVFKEEAKKSAAPARRAHGKGLGSGGASFDASFGGGGQPLKAKLRSDSLDAEIANTASYSHFVENDYKKTGDEPLSTFSADVDAASYANVRRFLVSSRRPPKDAVRIEEMINYFPYAYDPPANGQPFAVHTEVATAPWNARHKLVKIGIKGKQSAAADRPAANFVFLIDVSGSMDPQERLPLIQRALKLLVENLREKDRVALVAYAGSTGVVLDSTSGAKRASISDAIDRLSAGGSTNGSAGIAQAYDIAAKHFVKGGINRVILATDGDFNVGTTSEGDLLRLIEEKAKTGIYLTTLGVGTDNLKDGMMRKLADKGNGNYYYLDSIREARKVLVQQAGGTLNTIAKDVKFQVEFNPKYAASYRLIGYEKRLLNKEDFNDDTKDAGEVGEGHTVTALYEVVPPGADLDASAPAVDTLKYQGKSDVSGTANGELLNVKVRYKKPEGTEKSELIEIPVKDETKAFAQASGDFQFAAAVAGFGMILRESAFKADFTLPQVQDIAAKNATLHGKPDEYRQEFVELVKKARSLR